MSLNYQLTTEQRIELYENEISLFRSWARQARDENSRDHWLKKVDERLVRIEELKS